jgi:hypothetical protein
MQVPSTAPQWAQAVALGLLSCLTLAACSNDLDELFCDPNCPAKVATSRLLAFRPDPDAVSSCKNCTENACAQPRAACLEDDACTAQLLCRSECDDPGCLEDCRGLAGMDGVSPLITDLLACQDHECGIKCKTGQNWACTGGFRWPRAEGQSIEQRVSFGTSFQALGFSNELGSRIPLAGAAVRACIDNTCLHDQFLDASNSAVMSLHTGTADGTFRGFFEVESDEIGLFGTHYRVYWPPLSRAGTSAMPIITDLLPLSALGWLPSPELATLWVYAGDCQNGIRSRVRIELPMRPDARVAHQTAAGLSLAATETTIGSAFFPELSVTPSTLRPDSDMVIVQAVLLGSEEDAGVERVVSRREISLRKGWMTIVSLLPLASDE